MGFRINTNIDALSAHASATANSRALSSSLGRLNSGLRIQAAADDASGLAIADSLRSQASALAQAIANGNDAIGIIQTADKAMDEQLKILDTIKAKSVQAAQDGQTTETRRALQADISRLMEELDMIGNTTSFNGQKLLSGSFSNKEFQVGAYSNETVKASIGPTTSDKIGLTRFETGANVTEDILTAMGASLLKNGVSIALMNIDGVNDIELEKSRLAEFGGTFNGRLTSIRTSTLGEQVQIKMGMGLGGIAETINKVTDKTGVKASAIVETTFTKIGAGETSGYFAVNGVTIGKIEVKENDSNGALRSAINAVTDKTGVEASVNEKGELVLHNRDGRGIMVTGRVSIAGSTGLEALGMSGQRLNFGRLSLVRLSGNDIQLRLGTSAYSVAMVSANGMLGFGSEKRMVNATTGNTLQAMNTGQLTGHDSRNSNAGRIHLIGGKYYSVALSNVIIARNGIFSSGGNRTVLNNYVYSANTVSQAFSRGVEATAQRTVSLREMNGGKVDRHIASAMGFNSDMLWGDFDRDKGAGVTTLKGAMAMMNIAETAQKSLDSVRADLGSVQNQLIATVSNITVTQVNVKAAESQIRDVDFASESATFSKHNLLAQSGAYAMSQANAIQQNVMRLLQ